MSTEAVTPPWPLVPECHQDHRPDHRCAQCDGSHEHAWVTWFEAPEVDLTRPPGSSGTSVVGGHCGARKCDWNACMLRRHHREDHVLF